ncbi:A/G-specific adenine glycosylase [Serinicoccus sediminis]|uniref:A/G-specific adenine glycosylase n=1 Tax=Serinicoccus sediminis TaxID=2306021 RepID=UPI00192E273F|nr:A/G-specific adenine glycosylase [Serinicoccus sediminis]
MPAPETLHERLLPWYAAHRRDLPWRDPDCSPWGVLVSEVMLQQTPVARVLPVWERWMATWPTPSALAAEPAGAAVRAWGRLGYPRRALRLHAAATALRDEHDGVVPADEGVLRTLPGVGDYTAAAVAAFAFGRRSTVVDTNVRRVQARVVTGLALPPPTLTRAETTLATRLLPADDQEAATWSVAVMELGALVCTARAPRCADCPVADLCAWRLAGSPAPTGPPRRGQAWAGTDRQCRGTLLQVLRDSAAPVPGERLRDAWPGPGGADEELAAAELQRERCLDALVAEGLVEPVPDGHFRLPGT